MTTHRARFQLLALLTLTTLSCAPRAGSIDETEEASLALIGGDVAPNDSGAVLVMIKKVNYSKRFEWCTGAMVSPHVVVTAAHCVAITPADVPADAKLSIFVGASYDYNAPPTDPSLFYEIAESHIDPDYTDAGAQAQGHDIAVLVTKEALPGTPYRMIDGPLDDTLVGETVRLVGAGADVLPSTGMYSAGVRKTVSLPVTTLDGHYIHEKGDAGSSCEGDSGGPTLLTRDGSEVLIGIHAASVGLPACTGANYDTRLDLYADSFVRPIITAADPDFSEGGAGGGGGSGGDATATAATTGTGGAHPSHDNSGGCSTSGRSEPGSWAWLAVGIALVRRLRKHPRLR